MSDSMQPSEVPMVGPISEAEPPRPTPAPARKPAGPTRISAVWTAVAGGILLLILLIVFIVENLRDVTAAYFGAHWRLPLGIDLLLATVLGALVVLLVGAARVLQLRMRGRQPHAGGGLIHLHRANKNAEVVDAPQDVPASR